MSYGNKRGNIIEKNEGITKMKCKKIVSFVIMYILIMCTLSGCGEVKIYETEHECGIWEVSSFDELLLEYRLTAEEVAKEIPDFCLYKEYHVLNGIHDDKGFSASVPVSIKGSNYDFDISLYFNADKEFMGWDGCHYGGAFDDDYVDSLTKEHSEWYNVITDALGNPIDNDGTMVYQHDYNMWEKGENDVFLYIDTRDLTTGTGYIGLVIEYYPYLDE